MGLAEYYEILGLPVNSSPDEIKRAYRKKARLYHPDINHDPSASDLFIKLTEAYDFILANHEMMMADDQEYDRVMEDWRKYRQDRSRRRAQYYARNSYTRFRKSKLYKSTRILNASSVIFNFAISILLLIYTVFGYIFRINHPLQGIENPSILTFIALLLFSLILFTVSFMYLKAYIDTNKKQKKKR
jgi:hypothetical protein